MGIHTIYGLPGMVLDLEQQNAVQALPTQEVQFNTAQAFDEHHPANNWPNHHQRSKVLI